MINFTSSYFDNDLTSSFASLPCPAVTGNHLFVSVSCSSPPCKYRHSIEPSTHWFDRSSGNLIVKAAPGIHTLFVRAFSDSGPQRKPIEFQWEVSAVPPTFHVIFGTTFSSKFRNITETPEALFQFESNKGCSHFEFQLDENPTLELTYPSHLTMFRDLSEGVHKLRVRALDSDRLRSSSLQIIFFMVKLRIYPQYAVSSPSVLLDELVVPKKVVEIDFMDPDPDEDVDDNGESEEEEAVQVERAEDARAEVVRSVETDGGVPLRTPASPSDGAAVWKTRRGFKGDPNWSGFSGQSFNSYNVERKGGPVFNEDGLAYARSGGGGGCSVAPDSLSHPKDPKARATNGANHFGSLLAGENV